MSEPKRVYWLNIISSPMNARVFYKNIKYCEKRNSYYLICKQSRFPEVLEEFITSICTKFDTEKTILPKGPHKIKTVIESLMEDEYNIQKIQKKGFFYPEYKKENPEIDWALLELQNKEIYKQNLKLERLAQEKILSKQIQKTSLKKLRIAKAIKEADI